ncbi:hypothetical protein N2599_26975 (plasmid) [Rhizobium sullae]|uniref:Uncharacterized protein n=1 Tax=Rhizobium sullae TaxID=50338 RepID=A0ABY5XW21_RHISU|nr:hypothetical protein [Rhizobium sullae]UWU18830.1 hypothetical protein N2599_26975 [Rhizobium sullae]
MREWESSTAPERDGRYAEALDLKDGLGKEIRTMLDLAKVVPFCVAVERAIAESSQHCRGYRKGITCLD